MNSTIYGGPSFVIIILLILNVVSCSDNVKQNKIETKEPSKSGEEKKEEILLPKIEERKAESLPPILREKKIDDIYKSFLYEKTVCKSFVQVLEEDPELIEKIEHSDFRERDSFALLAKSKLAKNDLVQYVLTHKDYFFFDLDYHGGPHMIYVANSSVYCAQRNKQLEELEALGPSEQSWKIREHVLNLLVESLLAYGMPGYVGPIGFDFIDLKSEFEFTKGFYPPQFKNRMNAWMQKTALRLREGVNNVSEEFVKRDQQKEEVEKWIVELKKDLE